MEDGTMIKMFNVRLRTSVICLDPIMIPAESDMQIEKLLIIPVIRENTQEEEDEKSKPHTY